MSRGDPNVDVPKEMSKIKSAYYIFVFVRKFCEGLRHNCKNTHKFCSSQRVASAIPPPIVSLRRGRRKKIARASGATVSILTRSVCLRFASASPPPPVVGLEGEELQ